MNVLSLFGGMETGLIALKELGFKINNYYSSEIDKYASSVARFNHPEIIELGNIENYKSWELPKIDLIMAGFPCQSFSFAGKQLNFDDPRGQLFFKAVELLWDIQKVNPDVKFLFENVKMKKEFQNAISELLECEPVLINSALLSAQNRNRLYWSNWKNEQPLDKGILLKDILENNVDESFNVMGGFLNRIKTSSDINKSFSAVNPEKALPILSRVYANWKGTFVFKKNYLQYDIKGKNYGSQDQRAFYSHGKHGTIPSNGTGSKVKIFLLENDIPIRKLTPIECERIQTLPDNYTLEGVDIRFQPLYYGNKRNINKDNECKKHVKYQNVVNQSQVGKLNSAISTILDSLDLARRKGLGSLLIKAKNVQLEIAGELVKRLKVTALSTIKNGKENSQLTNQKNVRFAASQSGMGQGECVLSTIKNGEEQETLYQMKIENMSHTGTTGKNIIKMMMVDGLIELSLKKYSVEDCETEKSYIMLILINLIISKAIFMCVPQTEIISLYIDSLSQSRGSSLEMELLSLKMGNITKISNTSRYKMIGNGWTKDVVKHILSKIHE